MADDVTNPMQAVYDLFSGLYSAKAAPGAKSLLAFEIGIPITPGMFQLPSGPTPRATPDGAAGAAFSPALAVERLSEIANAVLTVSGGSAWRSNRTVDTMVEILSTQASPSVVEDLPTLAALQNEAARSFDITAGSLEGDFRFHPVYASPVDWYDPSVNANWTSHTIDLQNKPTMPPTTSPPSTVPNAFPKQLMWRMLPASNQAVLTHRLVEAGIQPTPATAPHPTPSVAVQPMARAPVVSITAGRPPMIARPMQMEEAMRPKVAPPMAAQPPATAVVHPVSMLMPIRPAIRPLIVANATAQVASTASPQAVTGDGIKISFEHCIVLLNRPWFPWGLLLTPNWYLTTYAQGAFANGKGDGDDGLLPVINSGFIAIRNLTISGKWSDADRTAIQSSVSVGPFSLMGGSYDSTTSTLTAPGMQIIGWFCDPLPVLPPNSKPVSATPSTQAAGAQTGDTAPTGTISSAPSPTPPPSSLAAGLSAGSTPTGSAPATNATSAGSDAAPATVASS